MDRNAIIQSIGDGAKVYLRAFALADCMALHNEDGLEWIAPMAGCSGPTLVYGVSAGGWDMDHQINGWVERVQSGGIPSNWFVAPDWSPGNVVELLRSKGFHDLSNPEEPEPAMALDLKTHSLWPEPDLKISVTQVLDPEGFAAWCDIVNEVLHGWPMVTVGHYGPWLSCAHIRMYLAHWGSLPVATAATIHNGKTASLEFVATKPEFRKRGMATAACVTALRELQASGVKLVSLRAYHDGTHLYESLGFQTYYRTVMLSYPRE